MSSWLRKYSFAWFLLNTQIKCSENATAQRKKIQPWNSKRTTDTKDERVIECKIQLPTAGPYPSSVCEGGVKDTALSHSIIYVNHWKHDFTLGSIRENLKNNFLGLHTLFRHHSQIWCIISGLSFKCKSEFSGMFSRKKFAASVYTCGNFKLSAVILNFWI